MKHKYMLWVLFRTLRDWHFPLAPTDYQSLHDALNAGFGWKSLNDLRSVCCTLWAKSRQEQEILFSEFDRLVAEFKWQDWGPFLQIAQNEQTEKEVHKDKNAISQAPTPETTAASQHQDSEEKMSEPELHSTPETDISVTRLMDELHHYEQTHLIFRPNYIVSYRQVAQAWRRLRRFVHQGPKTELDVESTIDQRAQRGVVTPLVLKARRRNAIRLLLLLDRQGSMTPFHDFTDSAIRQAIYQSSRFEHTATFYFHDVPGGKRVPENTAIQKRLSTRLFADTDSIAHEIRPLQNGYLFDDERLLQPRTLAEALDNHGARGTVVIVSDAGAARGNHDTSRIVNSIAFLKRLYTHTPYIIWLNPLPQARWQDSSAARIARYTPMFPITQEGLHKAVNVLCGQNYDVECPL